jgi:hypothetical protein
VTAATVVAPLCIGVIGVGRVLARLKTEVESS